VKRIYLSALVIVCVMCAVPGFAQNAQDVLENVRKKYDSIKDLELTFSQRVTFEMARIEQNTDGTLFLKKENKYRIELDEQTIVTNGKTVWSYSVQNHQVLIDNFKPDDQALTPERILTGAPGDFYATVVGKEKLGRIDATVLKLVPKNDQSALKSLRLWVDTKEWFIKKAEVQDAGGKETTYLVNDLKVNTGVQDARFTYQIPDGAEVVDLR